MTLELSNSTESPKLAVIVPVYKVEKYLPKCLDSIINQTYKNLQIICVDDGSPDNCGAILDEYAKKDSRIIVIHKENGGLSSARNAALDLLHKNWRTATASCPDFVTFVDSDDYLDLNTYRHMMSRVNDDIDVVCIGHECITNYEKDSTNTSVKANLTGLEGIHYITNKVITTTIVTVWNKIFRTEIIFRNNIRFPQGVLFEDMYFTTLYFALSRVALFSNFYGYKYLIRDDSITASKKYKKEGVALNFISIYECLLSTFKEKNLLKTKGDAFWCVFFNCNRFALEYSSSLKEEAIIYEKAIHTLEKYWNNEIDNSFLQRHYVDLIYNKDLKESKYFKCQGMLKVKHRLTYDKFYLLGVPVLKISFCDNSKKIQLFGITINSKSYKYS